VLLLHLALAVSFAHDVPAARGGSFYKALK